MVNVCHYITRRLFRALMNSNKQPHVLCLKENQNQNSSDATQVVSVWRDKMQSQRSASMPKVEPGYCLPCWVSSKPQCLQTMGGRKGGPTRYTQGTGKIRMHIFAMIWVKAGVRLTIY